VQCINIEVEKLGDPPKRMLTHFGIYIAKCMFCGLCSDVCPTQAIYHTKEFEGASEEFRDLVRFFVEQPVTPYKPPKKEKPAGKERDPAKTEARQKAAAAKKEAVASPGSDTKNDETAGEKAFPAPAEQEKPQSPENVESRTEEAGPGTGEPSSVDGEIK
jgi:ferredoxin